MRWYLPFGLGVLVLASGYLLFGIFPGPLEWAVPVAIGFAGIGVIAYGVWLREKEREKMALQPARRGDQRRRRAVRSRN